MFWENFYNLCQEKGTSPNAVCKSIGLSNATATGWKNGTMPKADVLCKLADALNVSLDFLLGRETKSTPNNDIRIAVIERVNLLSDVQAAQLLAFLESITKE